MLCSGNYNAFIGFQKGDYEDPALIRRALCDVDGKSTPPVLSSSGSSSDDSGTSKTACYRRLHADKPFIPGFFARQSASMSVVTNWAGFYKQLVLGNGEEECQHKRHCPLFVPVVPSVMPGAVIFKSDDNTTCLYVLEGKKQLLQGLVDMGVVLTPNNN